MITLLRVVTVIGLLVWGSTALAEPYGQRLCNTDPNYSCYKVKRNDSWQSLFPDDGVRNVVMRINRMDIPLQPGMIIAMPKHETSDLLSVAPVSQHIAPSDRKKIIVSLDNLTFGAYDESGTLVYWGPVSGGRGWCPDENTKCATAHGTFTIYRTEGPSCVSSKFPVGRGGAPMPYCMYFHNGMALHGSYEVPGYNDSHGCVRMFVDDAKWLNLNFVKDDGKDVTVIVGN